MRLSHSNVIKVVQKQPKDVDLKTGTLPYCATDDEQILKWNWSIIETEIKQVLLLGAIWHRGCICASHSPISGSNLSLSVRVLSAAFGGRYCLEK